ncbi:unnamed protein product [Caretta caretta]
MANTGLSNMIPMESPLSSNGTSGAIMSGPMRLWGLNQRGLWGRMGPTAPFPVGMAEMGGSLITGVTPGPGYEQLAMTHREGMEGLHHQEMCGAKGEDAETGETTLFKRECKMKTMAILMGWECVEGLGRIDWNWRGPSRRDEGELVGA